MTYNKSDTPIYRLANRIRNNAENLLGELERLKTTAPHELGSRLPDDEGPFNGDLEPPLSILELFTSAADLQEEVDVVLDK